MGRTAANFVRPAELMGHPVRSAMLVALLDGRALPMSMLASAAGVAPSTASEHLAKLTAGSLLRVRPRGRRRYFELASQDVADALAVLSRLTPEHESGAACDPNPLRLARTCYDHLAGLLGVAVTESLRGSVLGDGDEQLTPRGRRLLRDFGVRPPGRRRRLVGYCMDWTGPNHHLSGGLGAALLNRFDELGWLVAHDRIPRARVVTPTGKLGFARGFGVDVDRLADTPPTGGRPAARTHRKECDSCRPQPD